MTDSSDPVTGSVGEDPNQQLTAASPAGDDLVTDAELDSAGDDKFQAEHLVAEIASVIENHDPQRSANIALYGAWGSGKSSIARLLENEFDEGHPQNLRSSRGALRTKFVRFDAFKYAGHSLHRHFLLKVAEGLEIKARNYEERLYSSVTSHRVDLNFDNVVRLGKLVVLFIVLPTVIAAIAGAMAWAGWVSELSLGEGTRAALPEALALLSVPSAAGLFALMREILPSEIVTEHPSSEEQFEAEFSRLIAQTSADRVVIFVDEIDRCAPSEVVDTLDTIRTFLEVPRCLVVVAADQRVLERALSEKVRQTTPDETTNPYYSGGSAYLDKVFHYQFSIPPLLPTVISKYALDLVKEKGGVWDEVDCEEVVSILIPTHVRSPRRVKALLNNFVLTYRLASNRNVGSRGGATLDKRAGELAVLVCLRAEFPLFARELPQHPSLPTLIRWLHRHQSPDDKSEDDENEPDGVDPRPRGTSAAWRRARDYFHGYAIGDEPLPASDVEERGPDVTAPENLLKAIRDDLIGYLSKSAYVQTPGTDLIYLIDASGFFGLEADTAEELASLAYDANREDLRHAIRDLDEEGQVAALKLLAHRTREHAFGEEGSNMASSLLWAAYVASETALGECVDAIARAVEQQQQRKRLRTQDLSGALRVGLLSTWAGARGLVASVLETEQHRKDEGLALTILEHAPSLLDRNEDEVLEAVAWGLVRDGREFALVLTERMDAGKAGEVLRRCSLGVLPRVLLTTTTEDSELGSVAEGRPIVEASLAGALDRLLEEDDRSLAEYVASAAVNEGRGPLVDIVFQRASDFVPASTRELAVAALTAAVNRDWSEIPLWASIGASPSYPAAERAAAARDLSRQLWAARGHREASADSFIEALSSVQQLAPDKENRRALAESAIQEAVGEKTPNLPNVNRLQSEFEHIEVFTEQGIFPSDVAGNLVAEALIETLSLEIPVVRPNRPAPATGVQQDWAEDWSLWAAERSENDRAAELVGAVKESPWLMTPRRECLAIQVSANSDLDSPYDFEEIVAFAREHADDSAFGETLELWLTKYTVEPDEVFVIASSHLEEGLGEPMRRALSSWAEQATKSQRAEAIVPALGRLPKRRPPVDYLDAIHVTEADHRLLAKSIAAQLESINRWNDSQRRNVLDTWNQLDVSDKRARIDLLRNVAVVFAETARAGALAFLDYPELLQDPPGEVREELREAFRPRVKGTRERAMRKLLDKTGIDRKGFFEKATDIFRP